jgi:hypothetical protein
MNCSRIILFLAISSCIILYAPTNGQAEQLDVCFKNHCFNTELAVSPQERKRGLMFRKYLPPRNGMLFVFEEELPHGFYMKNTFIALDIIWLNSKKEVVFIKKNFQPCETDPCPVICPNANAKYVLELNAGMIDNMGLKPDDKFNFRLP